MIGWVLGGAAAIALAFALMSPLESLRWWARKVEDPTLDALATPTEHIGEGVADPEPGADERAGRPAVRRYVVYLSGVGAVDGRTDSRRERALLDDVAAALPDVEVAADVFPYSVGNRGLTQRASTWFWGTLHRLQRVPVAKLASFLINFRNELRVLVSADPRYGPTYNLAIAQEIARSLQRHGYPPGSQTPVTIIGYSGGGQIALGAAWYLAALNIPVSVISIAGVMCSDPALDRVQHLWHLFGSRDRLHRLSDVLFPARWRTAGLSAWNRGLRAGRITQLEIGPMRHMGGSDYFDRHAEDEKGRSYRQLTTDALVKILTD